MHVLDAATCVGRHMKARLEISQNHACTFVCSGHDGEDHSVMVVNDAEHDAGADKQLRERASSRLSCMSPAGVTCVAVYPLELSTGEIVRVGILTGVRNSEKIGSKAMRVSAHPAAASRRPAPPAHALPH